MIPSKDIRFLLKLMKRNQKLIDGSMKMKICYIAPIAPGRPEHTERWVRYFADIGHEVHVIISSGKLSDVGLENVKLHTLKRFGPYIRIINFVINLVPLVIQFKQILKNINPDVIHAHCIQEISLLGAISGFHPFVVTPWGSDVLIGPKKSKMLRWMVKYVLKKADLITSDGRNTIDTMLGFGINPQKIKLIFHGVDTKKFKPVKKDEKIIKNLSIFNSPIVISLRSFEPVYDVGTFIKSIPMILKKIANAKFIIAGEGAEEDYLKGLAKSLGILDSIRFVGWIPHEELPKYLSSSDVYVSTSLSDGGISISTLEAMACELAPVVTDVADNKKWIKDGENGFIVPTKDPKSLAEKIIYLLENENVRMKFGKINRKIVEEKQDYYKEMEKMEKFYKVLIKNNDKAKGGKYANTCSKDILP